MTSLPLPSLARRTATALLPSLQAGPSRLPFHALPKAAATARLGCCRYAHVSAPHPFQHQAEDSQTPAQRARWEQASPEERKSMLEQRRDRKLAEYQSKLKLKAMQEGVSSVEELRQKKLQEAKAASMSSLKPASSDAPNADDRAACTSEVERKDAEVAAKIRAQSEAEARRKLESGQLGSSPHGSESEGPVKPLHKILDVEKLAKESPDTIGKLWTGYHTLKGKLSAVIPTASYLELTANARKYPQFVLPLPREIIGGEETVEGSDATEQPQKQQGYEIQYLEWGFLPKPATHKVGGDPAEAIPDPTTVLFTPLAEYKMRQEFAQPALILSHYTDLADSKGIVLMRGEITGADEAADDASAATTTEGEGPKGNKVSTRISQADAQLLSMTLQRFYLAPKMAENGMESRIKLLETFHAKPEDFKVDQLVKASFEF
ncbi:uncharacterized protein PFL1_06478 [Pseudozyma flocculosa PF-1]|uniref:Related to ATP11 - F1F0-ATPase complex assembly protein n=2 Tax=Pseudozyma flocculosa TaxID=84751 RepID=A0A5C3EW38_9BASI|nr:uncharacterized protein PFL1_06478 [Pseudozyma flocculosa PF-1]EPQ26025.1 hypothetical protein PFL1_06478 [Pseudozyma flocculosa PF-1]SPO35667.1 related to ATP11 - F1F0-ATPase complex assembly protein [Pseudozyma flocculosa]